MPKFHPLTVHEVRQETADCVSVTFDIPKELAATFAFQPGQYLTLRTTIRGEDVRRSYSICSSPFDGELRVAIKKVLGGKFSTFANEQLAPGDTLHVMPPMGHFFTTLDTEHQHHYVAFAAGSGITPVMSNLKAILQKEPNSHFTLIYGNRTRDSIIFKEQLEALKNQYLGRLSVHHVLSREELGGPLFSGRIDDQKCKAFGAKLIDISDVDTFFVCGPAGMIRAVQKALTELGVDKKRIKVELFTAPDADIKKPQPKVTDARKELHSKIVIHIDGNTHQYELDKPGASILDTALQSGADLPFACKGGVCSTCRAKVLEGAVEMDVNYALEPEELEAGYVLTCQAHPTTERVVVSYDE